MIRRPPRSTLDRSSAASDVYKRQTIARAEVRKVLATILDLERLLAKVTLGTSGPVSYTHLRAHETVLDIVCRLLLEQQTNNDTTSVDTLSNQKIQSL